jgi:hypothetical protein
VTEQVLPGDRARILVTARRSVVQKPTALTVRNPTQSRPTRLQNNQTAADRPPHEGSLHSARSIQLAMIRRNDEFFLAVSRSRILPRQTTLARVRQTGGKWGTAGRADLERKI